MFLDNTKPTFRDFENKAQLLAYRDYCRDFFAKNMGYTPKEGRFNEVFAEFIGAKDFNTAIGFVSGGECDDRGQMPVVRETSIIGFLDMIRDYRPSLQMYCVKSTNTTQYTDGRPAKCKEIFVYSAAKDNESAEKSLAPLLDRHALSLEEVKVLPLCPVQDIPESCHNEFRALRICEGLGLIKEGDEDLDDCFVENMDDYLDIEYCRKIKDLGDGEFRDLVVGLTYDKQLNSFYVMAGVNDGDGVYETANISFTKTGQISLSCLASFNQDREHTMADYERLGLVEIMTKFYLTASAIVESDIQ